MRAYWMVAVALAAVPIGPANSAPTRAERAKPPSDASWPTRTVEDSRAVVLGSALIDRFQSGRGSSEGVAKRADGAARADRAFADRSHRRAERDAAPVDALDLRAGLPDFGAGFTGTVSPIPEPTSNFLFLAGVGLIALVVRRRFTAPRRIRS